MFWSWFDRCHLHLEAVDVNHAMWSKDLFIQEKQTIVRLQKQNQSIREKAGTLGATKSTVWYILRKQERTDELRNIKRPGWSTEDYSRDDRRIKKNPFTTSSQEKNTLQETDVSYNQEKTSPEQTQRWWSEDPLSSQHPAKRRTLSRRQTCLQSREDFTRANTRGDDRRILSLSQHPAKRRTLSRRQTCLQSREDFTRANTEVMIGGSSLFHNIQPREEHSPGDRRVYNQEKTSPEQTQRWWSEDPLSFTTSSQDKNTLQETDVSTIKRRLHQSKTQRWWSGGIFSLSQHPAKRRTLSRRQTCLQSREDFTRAKYRGDDRRILSLSQHPAKRRTPLQETDVSTIKRRLHQSKYRGDDRRILSLSQHPAKRRTLSRRQTCLQSREDFTRANTEVMIGGIFSLSQHPAKRRTLSRDRRVYNQEKTSPEQTQRWWSEDLLSFTTSSQEKNTLQETDVSTIKRRLHQSKYRGDDRRILSLSQQSSQEKNTLQETDVSTIKRRLHQSKYRGDDRRILSLSQHPAKRRTLSRRQTCLQSREDFTRANTELMIGGSSLFHTSSQEKNTLQETDVSTIKRRLHQSKHRGDDRRIFSLSQHPAKRRTLSRRQTCLQSREDSPEQTQRVMIGGSSLFHNIQQEKNSLRETDVSTIKRRLHQSKHRGDDQRILSLSQHPAKEKNTLQETDVSTIKRRTSPEQTQRWWSEDLLSFTTSSQEKNTLQETDVSTIKRRLHQSKYRGDDRRILSLSQHPAKRRTLSRRQTCLQSREDFTRANTEVMIGGSSLFHNIQPREEHSPGDRRVYNQEKTSPEQTQSWWSEDPLSFTTSSQEKNTLQETDVSTIKRRLHQSKHRGDDRRIFSLSQHPAKRRTLSRRQDVSTIKRRLHQSKHRGDDRRILSLSQHPAKRRNSLRETDVSTIKRRLHQSKHRGDDQRILSLSQHPAKRRTLSRRQTCLQSREDFTRATQRWWSEDLLSFTTSSQEKNTLQETDVSTIKRRLHQSKHRGDDRRIFSLSQHPAKRRTLSRRQTCLQSRRLHQSKHRGDDRRIFSLSQHPAKRRTLSRETDVSTIKRRLHQSKHRGDDRRILSLSQHPAKRRTLSRRQTCLQSREDFTRANTEVMIGGSSLFHNIQPREEHSPGDRRVYCNKIQFNIELLFQLRELVIKYLIWLD